VNKDVHHQTRFAIVIFTVHTIKVEHMKVEKGRFINPLFFHAQMVRVCSFTIRCVQNTIMTGRALVDIMDSLTRHLKPRGRKIVEH
jgi:hypothetical protein